MIQKQSSVAELNKCHQRLHFYRIPHNCDEFERLGKEQVMREYFPDTMSYLYIYVRNSQN